MRTMREVRVRPVIAALLAIGSVSSFCSSATAGTRPQLALFGSFSTVGSPLGEPDFGPLAAMDTRGETTLVWHSDVGPVLGVDTATIAPGHTLAGPVTVLNRGSSASSPALAEAPSGQAAVAWLVTQRASSKAGAAFRATALQLSERPAGGRFGSPHTIWSASEPETFPDAPEPEFFFSVGESVREGYPPPSVQIAMNPAGDEAVAWETSKLMVATRRTNAPFAAPVTVGSPMEGLPEEQPAVAVDPSGRVTVMWIDKQNQDLLASTWAAGELPSPPTILAQKSLPPVRLSVDSAGDELAAWLTGPAPAGPVRELGAPPEAVMTAAWRPAGGGFEPARSLTAPGSSAGEPVIALRGDGKALVAWTQAYGESYCSGDRGEHGECEGVSPNRQLHYATAEPGEAFIEGRTLTPRRSGDSSVVATWLADGTALLAWRDFSAVLAAHANPAAVFQAPRKVEEEEEKGGGGSEFARPSLAAGGSSDAVIAWGREIGEGSVAYAAANGLGGPIHPAVAPILEVLSNVEDIATERGIPMVISCSERCRLHATVRFVTRRFHRPTGGETFSGSTNLLRLDKVLKAGRTERLRIPASKQLLARYCKANDFTGAEITLSVRGLRAGGLRKVVEAAPEYVLGQPHKEGHHREEGGFCS
jgi:hypothetical protein